MGRRASSHPGVPAMQATVRSGVYALVEQVDSGSAIGDPQLSHYRGDVHANRAGRQHQPPGNPAG